jgi:hypothetical protein
MGAGFLLPTHDGWVSGPSSHPGVRSCCPGAPALPAPIQLSIPGPRRTPQPERAHRTHSTHTCVSHSSFLFTPWTQPVLQLRDGTRLTPHTQLILQPGPGILSQSQGTQNPPENTAHMWNTLNSHKGHKWLIAGMHAVHTQLIPGTHRTHTWYTAHTRDTYDSDQGHTQLTPGTHTAHTWYTAHTRDTQSLQLGYMKLIAGTQNSPGIYTAHSRKTHSSPTCTSHKPGSWPILAEQVRLTLKAQNTPVLLVMGPHSLSPILHPTRILWLSRDAH